jgi:hypothetical protein
LIGVSVVFFCLFPLNFAFLRIQPGAGGRKWKRKTKSEVLTILMRNLIGKMLKDFILAMEDRPFERIVLQTGAKVYLSYSHTHPSNPSIHPGVSCN